MPLLATFPLWIIRIAFLGRELFIFEKPIFSAIRLCVHSGRDGDPRAHPADLVDGGHSQGSRRGATILGLESVEFVALADRASDCSLIVILAVVAYFLVTQRNCFIETIEKRPLMTEKPDLAAELEFAKALASEAAAVAKRRCHHVTPQEKANLSYVTDLDHDLETMIRERLAARFPDDALSGEEYAASGGKGPRRWSIDPIDGTGNLVHGLPLWSISIGLIIARRADRWV